MDYASLPLGYTVEEMHDYEKFVSDHIGKIDTVVHEFESTDMHVDILVIPPSEKRPYYILLTMGMGAFHMQIPNYHNDKRDRAEVAMKLPANWDVSFTDIKTTWPVVVLKRLAKMPYEENSWVSAYHDIEYKQPFSEITQMCAIELDIFDKAIDKFFLETGSSLVIYNAIPIYKSELEYAKVNGGDALLELMPPEVRFGPLDLTRENIV